MLRQLVRLLFAAGAGGAPLAALSRRRGGIGDTDRLGLRRTSPSCFVCFDRLPLLLPDTMRSTHAADSGTQDGLQQRTAVCIAFGQTTRAVEIFRLIFRVNTEFKLLQWKRQF